MRFRLKTHTFSSGFAIMSVADKNNQYGCISGIRWPNVDGRKRCKKASVDEKLFIRFLETENEGFRKRISVAGRNIFKESLK